MLGKQLDLVIIEDNPDLCAGWQDILELDGHTVHCYGNGRSALEAGDVLSRCDAIISDYYLPDINGVDLLMRLRDGRRDLPAIILTGSKDATIRARALAMPRVSLLYKPLGIDDLEAGLVKLLQES